MPEALAVLLVGAICIAAYFGGRLKAGQPAPAGETLERMLHQRAWLLERRQRAERENWDAALVGQIERELAEIDAALDH